MELGRGGAPGVEEKFADARRKHEGWTIENARDRITIASF